MDADIRPRRVRTPRCHGWICSQSKHPVASILSDDHGRVAMNVVYDTYEDYLREKKEFNSLNDMIAFDADLCLDDEKENKENTGNFAEYVRMKRGIRFYYG